jgi:cell division protein FtsW
MQGEGLDISQYSFSNISKRTKGDKVIWTLVVLLTLVSLLAVYSSTGTLAYKLSKSTESYLFKQIVFIAIGVSIIYFAHLVNYTFYSKVAQVLYIISIPLLLYTLFFGTNLNDANRWIRLPIINLTFQTSDLAKLALFMYLSRQLSKRQETIKDFCPLLLPYS